MKTPRNRTTGKTFGAWLILALALLGAPLKSVAATNDLTTALQNGLFEEEANHNLEAAAQAYQTVSAQFDKDRKLAATAIFRLGEVYRKQGKTNEATAQYERIVREFSDQQTLAKLSQQNLANLNATVSEQASGTQRGSANSDAAILERVKRLSASERREVLPILVPDELLTQLLTQYQVAESDAVKISKEYSNVHPEMQKQHALLQNLSEQIERRIGSILKALEIRAAIAAAPELSAPAGVSSAAPVTDDEEKEIRRIQAMIQNSPDLINAPGSGGFTPLHTAANAGQLRVVQFLLEHGAAVNAPNDKGETALTLAASQGHKAMVELLLSRGANVNAVGGGGYTALHYATSRGFRAVAEILIENKASLEAKNNESNGQSTPLHLAAAAGQAEVVTLLLAKGAIVDARSRSDKTPLIVASAAGHVAAVKVLLAAKANPDAKAELGRTAMNHAAGKNFTEVVATLLANKADPNVGELEIPLATAVFNQRVELAEMLLQGGADANKAAKMARPLTQYEGGSSAYGPYSPLKIATTKQDLAMVKLLLKFKATPEGKLIAVVSTNTEIAIALLDAGADANAEASPQWPLLTMAASGSQPDLIKALLAHGARPDVVNAENRTALIYAAERGCVTCVEALLEGKADPNVAPGGLSPLYAAVSVGFKDIAEVLIAHGAEVNAPSVSRNTPLHRAVSNRNGELAALLLAKGADPNLRNKDGKTPLDWAKEMGTAGPVSRQIPQVPAAPIRAARFPGTGVATSEGSPITNLVALLREHGAQDDVPNFSNIELKSAGANEPVLRLTTRSNDWNQFTLLELLAIHYGLVTTNIDAAWKTTQSDYPSKFWKDAKLQFPDLSHMVIRRPSADGKQRTSIKVDVAELLERGDCSRNPMLAGGDIVELPELDHAVNDQWGGFSGNTLSNLLQCVSRKATISIKGTPEVVTFSPAYAPTGSFGAYGERVYSLTRGSFMLRPILFTSKLLRASSDISRVKVTRRDSATGKTNEWVLDCSNSIPDFWVRDGDVIEVPDKS